MGNESHAKKVEDLRALRIEGLPRFRITSSAPKTLYLIRHGQAAHNIVPKPWGEDLIDARLTDEGRTQATEHLRPAAAALPIEVVIVSPLTRAIDTALLGLSSHLEQGVQVVAVEGCREQIGQNLPDKRRAISALRTEYPQIVFDGLADADELFTPERETLEAISLRADGILELLMQRPEQHIAVVAHSAFLSALCNVALDTSAEPAIREWFENAELRTVRVEAC